MSMVIKHERNFTDDKIKTLAFHLNKRNDTMENTVTRLDAHLDDVFSKIETLGDTLGKLVISQADKIADLHSKVETLSSQNEQLMHSIEDKLTNHVKAYQAITANQECNHCSKTFETDLEYENHIELDHGQCVIVISSQIILTS